MEKTQAKPPLKGKVPALGGRRGLFPTLQRSRRLCRPPRPQLSISETNRTRMGAQVRRKAKLISSYSSGGGSGEGLLLEKPPSPELSLNQRSRRLCQPPRPQLPKQENAPTLHGREPSKEESSLFPAALRERGSGGEALLLEKRPLPQNLPTVNLFGREREGGVFSTEKTPPSHHKHFIDSLSYSSADHRRGSCRAGEK